MDQIGIALFGVTAVFLTQHRRNTWRRFACLFGMCSQPFWIYSAWTHEQWGILAVAFLYTLAWGQGIWNNWIRPRAL